MLIDKEIKINIKSSVIISKLNSIGIFCKMNDIIYLPIDKLWKSSNMKIGVKCDICNNSKILSYSMYNKNIKKYDLYTCSNKCANIKNKKTNLEKYGNENYNNRMKSKKTNLEKYGNEYYNNRKKSKNTCLEKYGVDSYFKTNKFKDDSIKTNLERYGVDNAMKIKDTKEKSKKTNIQKYGVDSYSKTDEYKVRVKNTSLERYGVDNYSKSDEYKVKVKNTSLERYGVDSPNKSNLIKEFKKLSMIKKYGYISNSMTPDSKEKLRKTNLERYGVEYPMQVLEFSEKQQKNSKRINYYNENIYYQGSYEKDFLDYMNNLNILHKISRGPIIKYNNGVSNKIHYPDFYIEEYNLIIEIKSNYYYYKYIDINQIKMKEAINVGYNYLYIINKDYTIFNKIISDYLQ